MGRRLLIVEDVAVIALDLQSQAEEAGWEVIGPAGSIDDALALIEETELDAAMLDLKVGSESIAAAARALRSREVPFVFVTGYELTPDLPQDLHDAPLVRKPCTFEEVARVMRIAAPAC
jgi:CheY-like chemotaxis protein